VKVFIGREDLVSGRLIRKYFRIAKIQCPIVIYESVVCIQNALALLRQEICLTRLLFLVIVCQLDLRNLLINECFH
jgi:hypothetical protein